MELVNRRGAMKAAAVVGVSALSQVAQANQLLKEADPKLAEASKNPQSFMFTEHVTFEIGGDGHSRDLAILSALAVDGQPTKVLVRPASVRIFRADSTKDDFTRQGGLYWSFRGKEGKVQFKQPGQVIMVVRDLGNTVHCYTMDYDLRC